MWPKNFFSPSYWAQVFWGPVIQQSNNGAVSAYRYQLHNTNEAARIIHDQRHELANTNQRTV